MTDQKKRIVTLTLSPALDLFYDTDAKLDLTGESVFRTSSERFEPGGKGFNVGRALHAYQPENTEIINIVVLGGKTGERWLAMAEKLGCMVLPIWTEKETRINVHLYGSSGSEIKINGQAGILNEAASGEIFEQVEKSNPDGLVIAGKKPEMFQNLFEENIMDSINKEKCSLNLDITDDHLKKFIELGLCPNDLIKINRDEFTSLCKIMNLKPLELEELYQKAKADIIVTDGAKTIQAFKNDHLISASLRNKFSGNISVGAGDYFLAGAIASRLDGKKKLKNQIEMGNLFSAAKLTENKPTQDWVHENAETYALEWED